VDLPGVEVIFELDREEALAEWAGADLEVLAALGGEMPNAMLMMSKR
jgi:hypothetical protein